jgi:precorrin-2 dehydrogenase/sirohydrochlorin ferrochelatase
MIPIYLDPAACRCAVIGRGHLALRRLLWLRQSGAEPDVWSDAPSVDLAAASAAQLRRRLPAGDEIARYHAIWIADLPRAEAKPPAATARAFGVLVNVEDVVALSDFHTPAVARRGRLTLAAGTGGASPAVARAARERLAEAFPPAWEAALDEIAQSRIDLRAAGAGFDALVADARERLAHHGLI